MLGFNTGHSLPLHRSLSWQQHIAGGWGGTTSRDKILLLSGTTKPDLDSVLSLTGTEMKTLRWEELIYFITDFAPFCFSFTLVSNTCFWIEKKPKYSLVVILLMLRIVKEHLLPPPTSQEQWISLHWEWLCPQSSSSNHGPCADILPWDSKPGSSVNTKSCTLCPEWVPFCIEVADAFLRGIWILHPVQDGDTMSTHLGTAMEISSPDTARALQGACHSILRGGRWVMGPEKA